MKLYFKRDTSSEKSRYIVYDEQCREKYTVSGRHGTSGEHMYIMLSDKKLARMREIKLGGFRAFSVSVENETIRIMITRSNAGFSLNFHGISWHIRGDIITKSYDILDADNTVVATSCKRFSKCSDGYELNIFSQQRELFCIACALCIDSIKTAQSLTVQMS